MIKWDLVWQFIATLLVPLLYLFNIEIILKTPGSYQSLFFMIVAGTIIALIGAIIWILSYINLGKNFGVLPQKQKRIRKGLYKYFNHPMYVGIYLTFLGLALANASWQGSVFLNLIILPILVIRAFFEERKLIN
jgi:protein-S-isoprenylcysteine O-methyltransferase Ste14